MVEKQQQIRGINDKITELEQVEVEMLQNLRYTVNEHNKLLEMQKSGNFDFNQILNSRLKFNAKQPGKWK